MSDDFMAGYGTDNGPKELPAEGKHQAVCAQVHTLGYQEFKGQVSYSPKCVFLFELDEKMKGGQMAGKPFIISERHAQYMGKPGKPSDLRKFLEKWKGKDYTEDEAKATNIKKCEGVPCSLMIIHDKKDDGTPYARIASISKRDTSLPLVPVTYTDVPQWITKEKGRAVAPPQPKQDAPKPLQPALAGGPPSSAEQDSELPF
jgi:hypothetical protein